MPQRKVPRAFLQERQDYIDLLDIARTPPSTIYRQCQNRIDNNKLPAPYYPPKLYRNPIKVFETELERVRIRRRRVLLNGNKLKALEAYIGQLELIYNRAMGAKKFYEAVLAAKEMAKARGLVVDQPAIIGDVVYGKKEVRQGNAQIVMMRALTREIPGTGRRLGELLRDAYRGEAGESTGMVKSGEKRPEVFTEVNSLSTGEESDDS